MDKYVVAGAIILLMLSGCVEDIDEKYFFQAIEQEDISICDKIDKIEFKDWCYDEVGQIQKNLSICDKIQDSFTKNRCYSGVAEAMKNLSLCNTLQDEYWKNTCIGDVGIAIGNPSLCELLNSSQSDKDHCFRQIAIKKDNASICEWIVYQDIKDWCYHELKENTTTQ